MIQTFSHLCVCVCVCVFMSAKGVWHSLWYKRSHICVCVFSCQLDKSDTFYNTNVLTFFFYVYVSHVRVTQLTMQIPPNQNKQRQELFFSTLTFIYMYVEGIEVHSHCNRHRHQQHATPEICGLVTGYVMPSLPQRWLSVHTTCSFTFDEE